MALFDIKKRSSVSGNIDTAQLSKEIKEKNQIVEQLKNEIEISKQKKQRKV